MLQEKLTVSHNIGETGQHTHTVLLSSESGSSEASLENENEDVRSTLSEVYIAILWRNHSLSINA